jgi:hypothetical protein
MDAPQEVRHQPAGDTRDLRSRAMCLLLVGALLSLAVVRYAGAEPTPSTPRSPTPTKTH